MTDHIERLAGELHKSVTDYVTRAVADVVARLQALEKNAALADAVISTQAEHREELERLIPVIVRRMADELRGPPGPKGEDGKAGADGKDGAAGERGLDGRDGHDGKDGAPGARGIDGKNGRDGRDAEDGAPGKDGKDGRDGVDGRDGFSLKDLELEHLPDGRTVRFKFASADGFTKSWDIRFDVPIDRGIFMRAAVYGKSDMVTYHNQYWIAQVDNPTDAPGMSKQWRMAMRNGKESKPVKLVDQDAA